MTLIKVTFEDVKTGKSFFFFSNGLDDGEYGILGGLFFNSKIKDAKTGETYIVKDKIINGLKEEE
jgi:hypothetical protein